MRVDFENMEPRRMFSTLVVNGTSGNDNIQLTLSGAYVNVTKNNVTTQHSSVTAIEVYGFEGSDYISVSPAITRAAVILGDAPYPTQYQDGANTLLGGGGPDALTGGNGNDDMDGGPGNDTLYGAPGNDEMFGSGGADYLYGNAGQDSLNGGTSDSAADRLYGNNSGQGSDGLSDLYVLGVGDTAYDDYLP